MRHKAYKRNGGIYPKTGKAMPKQYARPFSELQLLPERLEWPLHQKQPQRIFVNSMSDLFHSQVPEEFIQRVFSTMRQADWHTFQILTKRPGRLRRLNSKIDWPANVWMSVSVENARMTPRVDALRECGVALKFLSCEPLLGPLPSLDLEG
jgi:protein gp37